MASTTLRLHRPPRRGGGFTLVEMLIASAIAAGLMLALVSVARQATLARADTRDRVEALQQARFALQRVTAAARAASAASLVAPAANTSGDWFEPVRFCVNSAASLVETTTGDTGCTGTQVVAEQVASFSATLPTGAGALEVPTAVVSITTRSAADPAATVTLVEQVRLGGGTQ